MSNEHLKCGACGEEGNKVTLENHSCSSTNMSKITIKGHEVEYNFFDDDNDVQREMNDGDVEHVGKLLVEGYLEGELNQYDPEMEEEVSGWWRKS